MIKKWLAEVWMIYGSLLKIMLPILLLVRLIEQMGWVENLAQLIAPLMSWVGLPGEMGLVWMSAMVGNIYTSMAVFYQMGGGDMLSVAQVSVLGTMILLAHALPMEVAIAKSTGSSVWFITLLRVGGALVLGGILHFIYDAGGFLQSPLHLSWQPTLTDNSWSSWLITQGKTLLFALAIIVVLTLFIRFLRYIGVEKFIHWCLSPLLRAIGISQKAANFMIVGLTLGISFGGGLLIKEARTGTLSGKDIFLTMAFLSLFHSVIEDTLLVLLLGADLSAILWARALFSFILIAIFVRLLNRLPQHRQRWLFVDYALSKKAHS